MTNLEETAAEVLRQPRVDYRKLHDRLVAHLDECYEGIMKSDRDRSPIDRSIRSLQFVQSFYSTLKTLILIESEAASMRWSKPED